LGNSKNSDLNLKAVALKFLKFEPLFKISFFICLLAVEYLATTSRRIEIVESSWDKFNHFLAFGILYGLLNFGWQSRRAAKFYVKFCILLAFGAQIELVQNLLPNRYFSLLDIVADCVGIALGALICKILIKALNGKVQKRL
jgi:vanZ family protein